MTDLETAKFSTAVGKEQITGNDGGKSAKQTMVFHGLPTPESTPSPDTLRLKVDKTRQETTAKADIAVTNKGKSRIPSQAIVPKKTTSNGKSSLSSEKPTPEQKKQKKKIKRVFKCDPNQFEQILEMKDSQQNRDAVEKLKTLLNPETNKSKDVKEA